MIKIALITTLLITACGANGGREANLAITSTSSSELIYQKDQGGNIAKRAGWFSNDFRRGRSLRKHVSTAVTADGRTITVIREDFEYPDGLMIPGALGDLPNGDTFGAGKATYGSESRGSLSSRPYCIGLLIHTVDPLTPETNNILTRHGFYTFYCDADGDGIFETRSPGNNLQIPSWVK